MKQNGLACWLMCTFLTNNDDALNTATEKLQLSGLKSQNNPLFSEDIKVMVLPK